MRNYSYFTQMKTITTKIINQARLNGSMKFHVCRLASSTPFIEISNALREELRKVCDSKSAQGNADFKSEIKQLRAFSDELTDLSSLNDVCESDAVLVKECEELVSDLNSRYQEFKHTSVLSRPENRSSDCFIDLIAGAGGADSFDWVQMLVRMYSTWAKEEMEGYSAQLISATKNTDADSGYRNATLRITGPGCLGWLKADAGVHRLVRISPFDPQHKRHTSFAQVMVYPNVEADAASSGSSGKGSKGGAGGAGGSFISEGDVKMDTYRSSGAGGQSVNTTDSAVRLTHLPTGIVVTCQNERSQHQNKAFAMKVLRSKVAAVEAERLQRLKRDSMSGGGDGSWGQQIKSIVLNPYRMVKDHRTKWETGNVDGYLNGGHLLTESMRCQLEQEFLKSFTDT